MGNQKKFIRIVAIVLCVGMLLPVLINAFL
ncbi:Uncharacterised protein [Aedoeadaptatus ivorii]|uniref:Uncharacterized protein n=1 Tax=Aedoeadaptatus ivorii TaxID=54006 RepID=A0A3S5AJ60_9FIRM|nr:hypothetical protein [Peptoniphilus ivorii]VEJ35479.1 Uncharacterised protein [Peptoniphilus ivorii]